MITRWRLEHRSDGMEFGDGDGFLTRCVPCSPVALEREEDHERENDREHRPDHRQRAGGTRKVGKPATQYPISETLLAVGGVILLLALGDVVIVFALALAAAATTAAWWIRRTAGHRA